MMTMGYYTRQDLPFYYAVADAFTLCDNYHCSILGPTHPNRLMANSGTIDPAGTQGGPVTSTQSDPDVTVDGALDGHPRGAGGRRDQLEGVQPIQPRPRPQVRNSSSCSPRGRRSCTRRPTRSPRHSPTTSCQYF